MRYILSILIALITFTLWAQQPGESSIHVIQPGETLATIAKRYNTTVEKLQELNPKTAKYVYAGTKLIVPTTSIKALEQTSKDSDGPAVHTNVTTVSSSATSSASTSSAPRVAIKQGEGFIKGDNYVPELIDVTAPPVVKEEPEVVPVIVEEVAPTLPVNAMQALQEAIGEYGTVEAVSQEEAQEVKTRRNKIRAEKEQQTSVVESEKETAKPLQSATEPFAGSMELYYTTFTQANASTLRNAAGRFVEGRNQLKVLVRDNALHMTDSVLHIHTVLIPESNLVYLYSDVTKMGVQMDYDYYTSINMSGLAPSEESGGFEIRDYLLVPSGLEQQLLGYNCAGYKGRVTTPQQQAQLEIWQNTQMPVPSTMNYLLDGIVLQGLPMRYSIVRRGMSGYALNAGSVEANLTSLIIREVSNVEIFPDATIRFVISNDPAEAKSFYSDNVDALKLHGLYPTEVPK